NRHFIFSGLYDVERRIIGPGYPVLKSNSWANKGLRKIMIISVSCSSGHYDSIGTILKILRVHVQLFCLLVCEYLPVWHKACADRNVYLRCPEIGAGLLGI